MAGKGDTPRPFAVDDKKFSDNWERTFGAKAESSSKTEADRNGGQGEAQDGRKAEGND